MIHDYYRHPSLCGSWYLTPSESVEMKKLHTNVRIRAWKQGCIFYLILWLCHIDLLMCWMGTQNEDRVTLLIYRTDIFKMADWLISQMVFSEAVNHMLLSYSCSYEYYPCCAILCCHITEYNKYIPLKWQQLVILILLCFTVKKQSIFLQVILTVTNSKYLQGANDLAVSQTTDSKIAKQATELKVNVNVQRFSYV